MKASDELGARERAPVHVAGRGAVSAFGCGREALVEAVFAGRQGVAARRRTAAFRAPTRVAAEFPHDAFDPDLDQGELSFAAAVRAGAEALAEARVKDPSAIGLVLATTKAELTGLTGPGRGLGQPMRLARRVAERLGLGGALAAVSTACASGLSALASAERRIALGELERILVVGTDALSEFVMSGFGSMHLLDPDPCRPFDVGRRGISLGEGAGALLLSSHAAESIGVRIAGHGGSNDALHVTGCDRDGRGLARAVERALAHAGVRAADIDFIHLHGTGTQANDASEAVALATVFDGPTPPAFGTKAQTGHTLGASGILESVLVIAALERACVPANAGLREPGIDPRLRLVRDPLAVPGARRALKVASGFGGVQQALLFET